MVMASRGKTSRDGVKSLQQIQKADRKDKSKDAEDEEKGQGKGEGRGRRLDVLALSRGYRPYRRTRRWDT